MSAMRQKKCIFGRFSPLWCWVWRFCLFVRGSFVVLGMAVLSVCARILCGVGYGGFVCLCADWVALSIASIAKGAFHPPHAHTYIKRERERTTKPIPGRSNGRECRYNRLFFRCRPLPMTCSGLTGVLPASKVYLTYSRPIPGLYFCVPHPAAPKKPKNFAQYCIFDLAF